MSSTGADWEVATCFPPGDRRKTPTCAAQGWPGAQCQGRGKSTPWISIVFTQQLYHCVYLCSDTAWLTLAAGWSCPEKADESHLHWCSVQTLRMWPQCPKQQEDSSPGVSHRYYTALTQLQQQKKGKKDQATFCTFAKYINRCIYVQRRHHMSCCTVCDLNVCSLSEDTVMSESTSSMSDSTSHDNGESTVYNMSFKSSWGLWRILCCISIFTLNWTERTESRKWM